MASRRLLRSPAELRDRLRQKSWVLAERLLPELALPPVRAVQPGNGDGSCLGGIRPEPWGQQGLDAMRVAQLSAAHRERVIAVAEQALRGEVEIFGLGPVPVGSPPRWHHEPIAGLDAPRVHWSRVPYLDRHVVGDHKVLWEFNRHQYLVHVAQAWVLTRDPRYPQLIAAHVRDWMAENPPGHGANWASSLEVAYRAIAWCWTLHLTRGAAAIDDALVRDMSVSLAAHARHVERYLSTWFSPNTHLTGEALGLVYIGQMFPMLRGARGWRAGGRAILHEQLFRQVHADGVYFEQATQYHRYTAEIYLHLLMLDRAAGIGVPRDVTDRISALFDVLLHLSRADGTMALVGDDDGGLLLPLDGREPHELRGLLHAAGRVLGRADLVAAGRDAVDHTVWFLGGAEQSLVAHHSLAPADAADMALRGVDTATYFPVGGLVTIRDGWESDAGHVTLDAGPHGALSCGHSHADALSLELFAGGAPLLVDSGTYTYVGDERNAFRGTAAHNVLELDDVAVSLPAEQPFKWHSRTDVRALAWATSGGCAWFEGAHDGYARLASPAQLRRALLHPARGAWVVEDISESEGPHSGTLRWYLAPGVSADLVSHGKRLAEFRLSRGGRPVASLVVACTVQGSAAVAKSTVSPRFGRREASRCCRWDFAGNGDAAAISVVVDWTNRPGSLRLELDGMSLDLVHPDASRMAFATYRWSPTTLHPDDTDQATFRHCWTDGESSTATAGDVRGEAARVLAGPGLRVEHAVPVIG